MRLWIILNITNMTYLSWACLFSLYLFGLWVSNLFIHIVFLSLFICFLTCSVWGLHFTGFRAIFFSTFWFLPSVGKFNPVVCEGFLLGVTCACILVGQIFIIPSAGQSYVRWYVLECLWESCLLIIEFVFLSCLLFRWGILHWMLLSVGWCQFLYTSGCLYVNSH